MVKFYTSNFSYDYPFPAVSLAYFLRYPNPHSTHVLSTDVISREYDPATQRLYTTRLHLKQSRLPPAVMKLLPKNILSGGPGRGANGEAQNFVLEKTVVDAREGWMETETRNLAYTGILSVVERQRFARPPTSPSSSGPTETTKPSDELSRQRHRYHRDEEFLTPSQTDVETTVTFVSRFGQQKQGLFRRRQSAPSSSSPSSAGTVGEEEQQQQPKKGFFSSLSTGALQRTIEATGMQRTRNALLKSKEGMDVVLERMRTGGLSAVLDGMRRDRELVVAAAGGGASSSGMGTGSAIPDIDTKQHIGDGGATSLWKNIWRNGVERQDEGRDGDD